jgi:hypothetical protein
MFNPAAHPWQELRAYFLNQHPFRKIKTLSLCEVS